MAVGFSPKGVMPMGHKNLFWFFVCLAIAAYILTINVR